MRGGSRKKHKAQSKCQSPWGVIARGKATPARLARGAALAEVDTLVHSGIGVNVALGACTRRIWLITLKLGECAAVGAERASHFKSGAAVGAERAVHISHSATRAPRRPAPLSHSELVWGGDGTHYTPTTPSTHAIHCPSQDITQRSLNRPGCATCW